MAHISKDLRTPDELDAAYKSEANTFANAQAVPVVSNKMIVMGRVGHKVCYRVDFIFQLTGVVQRGKSGCTLPLQHVRDLLY